jgi:hypothetical protein
MRGKWSVALYPNHGKSKYGEYREAWDLLRGELPEVIGRIEACAEEDFVQESPLLAKEARNGAPGSGQGVSAPHERIT